MMPNNDAGRNEKELYEKTQFTYLILINLEKKNRTTLLILIL